MQHTIASIKAVQGNPRGLEGKFSFMALVTNEWNHPAPTRGTDYFYTYRVIDEDYTPDEEPLRVRVFSPTKDSLPIATTGDVILIQNGMVRLECGVT